MVMKTDRGIILVLTFIFLRNLCCCHNNVSTIGSIRITGPRDLRSLVFCDYIVGISDSMAHYTNVEATSILPYSVGWYKNVTDLSTYNNGKDSSPFTLKDSFANFCKYWRLQLRFAEIATLYPKSVIEYSLGLLISSSLNQSEFSSLNLKLSLDTRNDSLWVPLIGSHFGNEQFTVLCPEPNYFVVKLNANTTAKTPGNEADKVYIQDLEMICHNGETEKRVVVVSDHLPMRKLGNLVQFDTSCSSLPATGIAGNLVGNSIAPVGIRLRCSGNYPVLPWIGVAAVPQENRTDSYRCDNGSFIGGFQGIYDGINGRLAGIAPICTSKIPLKLALKSKNHPISMNFRSPFIYLDSSIVELTMGSFDPNPLTLSFTVSSTNDNIGIFLMRQDQHGQWKTISPSTLISYEQIMKNLTRIYFSIANSSITTIFFDLTCQVFGQYLDFQVAPETREYQVFFVYPAITGSLTVNPSNDANHSGLLIPVMAIFMGLFFAALTIWTVRKMQFMWRIKNLNSKSVMKTTKSQMLSNIHTPHNLSQINMPTTIVAKDIKSESRDTVNELNITQSYIRRDDTFQVSGSKEDSLKYSDIGKIQSGDSTFKPSISDTLFDEESRNINSVPVENPIKVEEKVIHKLAHIAAKRNAKKSFPTSSNSSNSQSYTPGITSSQQKLDGSVESKSFTLVRNNTYSATPVNPNGPKSYNVLSIPGYLSINLATEVDLGMKIASGSSSSVHHGVWRKSSGQLENVAIKFVNHKDPSYFRFEIAILGSLPQCKNVVQLLGYFENPNGFMMTLYSGNLATFIFDRGLPLERKDNYKMAHDIASGLDHIHKYGIVHFDVKPKNVMVDRLATGGYHCAIGDFGNAKLIGSEVFDLKIVHGLKVPANDGITKAYCSPEILALFNEKGLISCSEKHQKGDVYSYAMTLYEIICRRKVWENLNAEQMEAELRNKARPLFSRDILDEAEKDLQYLPTLISLIKICWNQDPDQRPSFADIISKILCLFKEE